MSWTGTVLLVWLAGAAVVIVPPDADGSGFPWGRRAASQQPNAPSRERFPVLIRQRRGRLPEIRLRRGNVLQAGSLGDLWESLYCYRSSVTSPQTSSQR